MILFIFIFIMTAKLYNYITSFSSSLYDYIYKENEQLTRCVLKQDKDIINLKKNINDKNKELIELQLIIFNKDKEIESYDKKLKDINKKIKDFNDYIVILWDTINIKDKEMQKLTNIKQEIPILLCSICLDEIDDINKIETRCNHIFHKNCLDKWESNTCPNCRSFL